MSKFVFVVTLKATDDNENFRGESRMYVYGKSSSGEVEDSDYFDWFVKTCGYNRKCDAVRCMNWHKNNLQEKYWTKEYKLVEVTL